MTPRIRAMVLGLLAAVALVGGVLVAPIAAFAEANPGVPFTLNGDEYRISVTDSTQTLQTTDGSTWTDIAVMPHASSIPTYFDGEIFVEAGYTSDGSAVTPGSLYVLDSGNFAAVQGAPAGVYGTFSFDGELCVRTNGGLWRSSDGVSFEAVDGSPDGPEATVEYKGSVYFLGFTGPHDISGPEWYRYDGTTFTKLTSSPTYVSSPVVFDGYLYFRFRGPDDPTYLWRYDGTTFEKIETGLAADLYVDTDPVVLRGRLYVGADLGGAHEYLYSFDGTAYQRVTGLVDFVRLDTDGDQLYHYGSTGTDTYGWIPFRLPVASGTASITGPLVANSPLTAATAGWPDGASFTYQWERSWEPIPGATDSTYTPTADDVGHTMQVLVTGSVDGYTDREQTAYVGVVAGAPLTATPTPTVVGSHAIGQVLTATTAAWAPSGVVLTYRWRRAGSSIEGATHRTYTTTSADADRALTVTVTGALSGYASVSRTSAGLVVERRLTSTPTPTINGVRRVGSTLTAEAGRWGPGPVGLYFVWKRNGVVIRGATRTSYRLTKADKGTVITVAVTGTRSGYTSVTRTRAVKI